MSKAKEYWIPPKVNLLLKLPFTPCVIQFTSRHIITGYTFISARLTEIVLCTIFDSFSNSKSYSLIRVDYNSEGGNAVIYPNVEGHVLFPNCEESESEKKNALKIIGMILGRDKRSIMYKLHNKMDIDALNDDDIPKKIKEFLFPIHALVQILDKSMVLTGYCLIPNKEKDKSASEFLVCRVENIIDEETVSTIIRIDYKNLGEENVSVRFNNIIEDNEFLLSKEIKESLTKLLSRDVSSAMKYSQDGTSIPEYLKLIEPKLETINEVNNESVEESTN